LYVGVGEKNEGQDFRARDVEAVRLGDQGDAAVAEETAEFFATAGDVGGEAFFEVEDEGEELVGGWEVDD
jgi:hypothetical protein